MQTLKELNEEYRKRVRDPEAADSYGVGRAADRRGQIHLTCDGKILCKGVPVAVRLDQDTEAVTCQWCLRWLASELSA